MIYPAHILVGADGSEYVQTAAEHCRLTAQNARRAAPPCLYFTAYLCGLIHDMGKFTLLFADYIRRAAHGEPVRRGSVNHTFAAVRFVMERWHTKRPNTFPALTAEIIAYAAGAHHGQFDCIAPNGSDGFSHRLAKQDILYEEARDAFLAQCAEAEELDRLFAEAEREVTTLLQSLTPLCADTEEMLFYTALTARLLLCAVIEGDRSDTAAFMQQRGESSARRDNKALFAKKLAAVERHIASFGTASAVDSARGRISAACRESASETPGIYRLTVPTGGGKTLSSLRYALACKKERIFFVIPLLSVLEQNAKVLRDLLGDDMILEHHSNVLCEMPPEGELDPHELIMENWDSPVVVTTLVQLLNTLFDGRTSCIRRMSALCGSVIVIDEVQSVPRKMLSLFNLALNMLVKVCGAKVVLCSATQPSFDAVPHALRYAASAELVTREPKVWAAFSRTRIIDRCTPGGYTADELADMACTCAEDEGSVLLICNTRSQAKGIYRALRSRCKIPLRHLSNSMCMEHRIAVLDEMTPALKKRERMICVSTQLVEAGVDFSFACVIRLLAGIDNIVQSAGRCNRSGEYGLLKPVYIVNMRQEDLSRLHDIQLSQVAARSVLLRYKNDPGAFEGGLTGEKAVDSYYRTLFSEMSFGEMDFPLPKTGMTMFEMLSLNNQSRLRCDPPPVYTLAQAFRTAGDSFDVFESGTTDVVVPYGEGRDIIVALGSESAAHDAAYLKRLIKKAARFCISLYDYQIQKLRDCGGVYTLANGAVTVLADGYYSDETGFEPESGADSVDKYFC